MKTEKNKIIEEDLGICVRCKKNKATMKFTQSITDFTHGFVENICQECYHKIRDSNTWYKEGIIKGIQSQKQKIIEEIEKMIKEQEEEFERCKELRTTRMKNADSKNCGMVDAEVRIEHYNEVKLRLEKNYGS